MSLVSHWYNKFRVYFSEHHSQTYVFCERYKSVIKFIISGTIATGTDLLVLFVLYGLLKLNLILSTSLAFVLSFFVSFSLQKFWTFRNRYRHHLFRQFLMYVVNAGFDLGVNALLMHLFVNKLAWWYLGAQVIVNLIIGFWNFTVYKFVIFKKNKDEIFF